MSPHRASEFARGRDCARSALSRVGILGEVDVGASREPIWPPGVTGSITHTQGYTAAIVGVRAELEGLGLGLDAERVGAMTQQLIPEVLVAEELDMLARHCLPLSIATVCFAAKEAFFKAQFQLWGQWVEFHHLRVQLVSTGRVHITPTPLAQSELEYLPSAAGNFVIVGDLVVVAVLA